MEQEIIEMKNIVKNELTVQHDTIICDPYLGRVYYKIKYGKVWWCSIVKMFLNSWYYMSGRVYLYFWIDFTPTGHVRLEYSCPDAVN